MNSFYGLSLADKRTFLIYEFLGCAVLSFAFNMNQLYSPSQISAALLIASLWSWDQSIAHFNPGLTFGQLWIDIDNRKKRISFVVILLFQLLGGLLGVGLTALVTWSVNDPNGIDVWYSPEPVVLCPTNSYSSQTAKDPISVQYCATPGLQNPVFKSEFVASFIFYMTYGSPEPHCCSSSEIRFFASAAESPS